MLEWDPNPEPTVAGYNVYIGTSSGNYTQVQDVGLKTMYPLTNLDAAVTYYFAVTAYDTEHLESPFSDEVWFTPRVDGTNAVQLPFSLENVMNVPVLRFEGRTGQRCWVTSSYDLRHWEKIFEIGPTNDMTVEFRDSERQGPYRFFQLVGDRP